MSLSKSIKRVERYRDDIVTHGDTAKAMTEVIEAAQRDLYRQQMEEGGTNA